MNKFNILYWNIHYADGQNATEKQLNDSSEIIIDTMKQIISEKKGTDDEIHAVVFSEAYPQFNSKENKTNKPSNNKLYNYFKNEEKFYVYPYDEEKYNEIGKYPFRYGENNDFTNGIFIATKEQFNKIRSLPVYPNILVLENEKLVIMGIRMISEKIINNYLTQAEKVKKFVNYDKKNIIIGDFNNGNLNEVDFNKAFNSFKIYDNCEFGTMVALVNKEGGSFCINNPDKLLYLNCEPKKFVSLKTPEQVYCLPECLDNNRYIGKQVNSRFGRLGDDALKITIKKHIGKKRTQNLASADIDYNKVIFKDKYKNYGIRFQYNTTNVCTAPFPDHNLLFASIDLGDE